MIVLRSFDVNRPGTGAANIKGGIAGGTILQGVIKLEQDIEIRPGIVEREETGKLKITTIFSRVSSLSAERNELKFAVPGRLNGVGTQVDPALTRADRLVGQVLGENGTLPEVFTTLEISFFLLRKLLGIKSMKDKKHVKVSNLVTGELLMLNVGS